MATLAEGSSGKPVKKLQTELNKVMSSGLKTTGTYDDKTKDAVEKFQKKAGLKVSGRFDAATQKSLKAHIVGLTWPHGDPVEDKKSVNDAIVDARKNGTEYGARFKNAEAECRAVAEILKKQAVALEAATTVTVKRWTELAKSCGGQADLKKEFDAARKAYDLGKQREILAKAKKAQEQLEMVQAIGYGSWEAMGSAAYASFDALERLGKLEGVSKKVAKIKCGA